MPAQSSAVLIRSRPPGPAGHNGAAAFVITREIGWHGGYATSGSDWLGSRGPDAGQLGLRPPRPPSRPWGPGTQPAPCPHRPPGRPSRGGASAAGAPTQGPPRSPRSPGVDPGPGRWRPAAGGPVDLGAAGAGLAPGGCRSPRPRTPSSGATRWRSPPAHQRRHRRQACGDATPDPRQPSPHRLRRQALGRSGEVPGRQPPDPPRSGGRQPPAGAGPRLAPIAGGPGQPRSQQGTRADRLAAARCTPATSPGRRRPLAAAGQR